ncbi:hypothetical protein ACHAXH_006086 [Discostella pseudostelligera]
MTSLHGGQQQQNNDKMYIKHHNHQPLPRHRHYKRRIRQEGEGAQHPLNLLPLHQLQLHQQHNNHHPDQQQQQSVIRYDAVADAFNEGAYGVVHQLPCIPDRRRMIIIGDHSDHKNKIHNLTYFLEARLSPHEQDRPLYIYNPMILPLNADNLDCDSILKDLGFDEYGGGGGGDASYIAVYRVSNFGNCHGPGRGAPETYRNYLGIALLDSDLNILPRDDEVEGYQYLDIVIDLNRHLSDMGWSPKTPDGRGRNHHRRHAEEDELVKQYLQDCQLIAVPTPNTVIKSKADRLILICNNYAMEVRLERTSSSSMASTNHKGTAMRFTNAYGSGLQLTAITLPRTIASGKNLHYFRVADEEEQEGVLDPERRGGSGTSGGYLEIWPGGPHELMRINFTDHDRNNHNFLIKADQSEPDVSYLTVDGTLSKSPLIDRDSGSACCISILWRDERDEADDIEGAGERRLLLGFSHRKTRRGLGKANPPYNYVSRVYAFEPTPPFNIVARSGYFCLGFALKQQHQHHRRKHHSSVNDEANQSDNEQVWGAANEYKLTINGVVFENCPSIHFVTGIADKLGDEEQTAIVSYGVNDCYPRMVEVSKKFLVSLLRPLSST